MSEKNPTTLIRKTQLLLNYVHNSFDITSETESIKVLREIT